MVTCARLTIWTFDRPGRSRRAPLGHRRARVDGSRARDPARGRGRIAKAIESSRSEGTRKTYAVAWRRFTGWCNRERHVALPTHPVTVAAYLVDAADTSTETGERAYAVATFGTWIAAINHQHRTTGHLSPTAHELVTATLSGIRREYAAAGDRPRTPRDPLLVDDIRVLVSTARERSRGWADEVLERRDSAILLLGFAGAFRRSELSDLLLGDVSLHRLDGIHVRLRKSKTDREGRGAVKALPYTESHATCPPCAYVRWTQVVAAFDAGGRPLATPPQEGTVQRTCVPRGRAPHCSPVTTPAGGREERQPRLDTAVRSCDPLDHPPPRRTRRLRSHRPDQARRTLPAVRLRHPGHPQQRRRIRHRPSDRPRKPRLRRDLPT